LEEIKCHNEKARIPIAKFVSHCFVCWIIIIQFD
jgi:hypothetical protein